MESRAEWSRALFGNSHMLGIISAIVRLEGDEFTVPQIILSTGVPGSIAHPLVARLVLTGLVEKIGYVPGEKTALYRRNGFDALGSLVSRAEQLSAANV